jgi:hypothetical protein
LKSNELNLSLNLDLDLDSNSKQWKHGMQAEKAGKFYPTDDWNKRSEVVQWLFFMNAGIGPMQGSQPPHQSDTNTDHTVLFLLHATLSVWSLSVG